MVVERCGEARIHLCQQCHNEQMVQQDKPRLNSWQCRAVVEKKAHRGRMWKIMESEQVFRAVWEYFTLKRAEAKNILEDAARERREGIHGQRQQESLFSEILEQVRGNVDGPHMMRKGFLAMRRWQLGRVQRRTAEKKIIHQNGPRENTRSLRESGER